MGSRKKAPRKTKKAAAKKVAPKKKRASRKKQRRSASTRANPVRSFAKDMLHHAVNDPAGTMARLENLAEAAKILVTNPVARKVAAAALLESTVNSPWVREVLHHQVERAFGPQPQSRTRKG